MHAMTKIDQIAHDVSLNRRSLRLYSVSPVFQISIQLGVSPGSTSITKKLKSILKPTSGKEKKNNYPISPTKAAKGVLSSAECFMSEYPTPIAKAPEIGPELYNYRGQVVTRSAMELLEAEDRLAAKGGLFERDGVIMTASALSLLQAQEAMDRADSAGQGEYGREQEAFMVLYILLMKLESSGCLGSYPVSNYVFLLCCLLIHPYMSEGDSISQSGQKSWIPQISGPWFRKMAKCQFT